MKANYQLFSQGYVTQLVNGIARILLGTITCILLL